jgi:hypothetical protein
MDNNNMNNPVPNNQNNSVPPPQPVAPPPPNPTAPTQPVSSTGVLSDWPGAFKIYKASKAAVMLNLAPIIEIYLITFALSIIYTAVTGRLKLNIVGLLIRIIYEIVEIVLSSGIIYATIQGVHGKKVTVSDAMNLVFKKALNIVAVTVLLSVILFVSFILLIVPFFFVMPRVYLSLLYVIDQDLDPIEALKASWENTRHHEGKFYGILGVYILICLPIITIIGILATIYFGLMYSAAFALLYLYISKKQPALT